LSTVDDVAGLFLPPAAGPSQTMAYRQGIVTEFNPVTLENKVDVGGTELTDLPLLGVGEATLLAAGAVVGLLAIGDTAKTFAIVGRLVHPNTAQARDATGLLSANTKAATVGDQEGTDSTTYTDLATVGPQVTVTVRSTGRLLVSISFGVQALGADTFGGSATVAMTGANTITADTAANTHHFHARHWHALSGGITLTQQDSPAASTVFEGLTPGETVVTMKYRSINGGAPDADFGRRTLVVIAL
jgi:hypothetical protein